MQVPVFNAHVWVCICTGMSADIAHERTKQCSRGRSFTERTRDMNMERAAGRELPGWGGINQTYQSASSKPVISTLIKIFLEICKSKYQGPEI